MDYLFIFKIQAVFKFHIHFNLILVKLWAASCFSNWWVDNENCVMFFGFANSKEPRKLLSQVS